jgi:predicted kinase
VPAVRRALDENFHTLESVAGGLLDRSRLASAERFAKAFLRSRAPHLHERARHGHMRDGHGDLRPEHIVLEDGVEIVDCLEFDPALRQIDVSADLAFLVMELVARDRADLAEHLVWAYRDAGGDPGDDTLIAFFAAYRALVRAKVAAIRADQLFVTNPERAARLTEAARLIELAGGFAWRARLPCVLVVCGVPGAGKSHLAGMLGELSGLPVLGSDATRKGLIGLSPTERAPAAAYVGDMNDRTYRELGRRACVEHAVHGGAIVDATFRRADDRAAFFAELAGSEAQIVVVECIAPAQVRSARARARERSRNRVSDATAEIAAREASAWEPLDDVSPDRHVVIRTDRELGPIVADLEAMLDHYLAAGRLDAEGADGPTSSR